MAALKLARVMSLLLALLSAALVAQSARSRANSGAVGLRDTSIMGM